VSAGDSGDSCKGFCERAGLFAWLAIPCWPSPCRGSPLDQNLFLEAADLYRRARRAGVHRPLGGRLSDCSLRYPQRVSWLIHQDRDLLRPGANFVVGAAVPGRRADLDEFADVGRGEFARMSNPVLLGHLERACPR